MTNQRLKLNRIALLLYCLGLVFLATTERCTVGEAAAAAMGLSVGALNHVTKQTQGGE